jgi:hypothetical protein
MMMMMMMTMMMYQICPVLTVSPTGPPVWCCCASWSEEIFNHISLRLPGPDHHFLINPFGLTYGEVSPA